MAIKFDSNKPLDFNLYIQNLHEILEMECDHYRKIAFLEDESTHFKYERFYKAHKLLGVHDIHYMRSDSVRQLLSDQLFILGMPNGLVKHIAGDTAKELLLTFIGRKYYWPDLMNSSTSLEKWANHFINKTTSADCYPYTEILVKSYEPYTKWSVMLTGIVTHGYCDTCGHHYSISDVMHKSFYSEYYPCHGTLTGCDCPECNQSRVITGIKKAQLLTRNRIRACTQARNEGTLKEDDNGLLLYPVELWAKQQIGHLRWGLTNDKVCKTIKYYDGSLHDVTHHDLYATSFKIVDILVGKTVYKAVQFIGTCYNKDCRFSTDKIVTPPRNTYF